MGQPKIIRPNLTEPAGPVLSLSCTFLSSRTRSDDSHIKHCLCTPWSLEEERRRCAVQPLVASTSALRALLLRPLKNHPELHGMSSLSINLSCWWQNRSCSMSSLIMSWSMRFEFLSSVPQWRKFYLQANSAWIELVSIALIVARTTSRHIPGGVGASPWPLLGWRMRWLGLESSRTSTSSPERALSSPRRWSQPAWSSRGTAGLRRGGATGERVLRGSPRRSSWSCRRSSPGHPLAGDGNRSAISKPCSRLTPDPRGAASASLCRVNYTVKAISYKP